MELFIALVFLAMVASHQTPDEPPQPVVNADLSCGAPQAPCPTDLPGPRVRDLTVSFEERVYLGPSGKICRPAPAGPVTLGSSAIARAHGLDRLSATAIVQFRTDAPAKG